MKEIVITNKIVNEVEGFIKETTVEFSFDGETGTFTITDIDGEISYEVAYLLGYARWNPCVDDYVSSTTFNNDGIFDYRPFLEAFKNKFGNEIPTR